MGGGGKELNRGKGSVLGLKFLCLEYDTRAYQASNETDSWERDHSCITGNVTTNGKYLGEVDIFDIDPRKTHCRVL